MVWFSLWILLQSTGFWNVCWFSSRAFWQKRQTYCNNHKITFVLELLSAMISKAKPWTSNELRGFWLQHVWSFCCLVAFDEIWFVTRLLLFIDVIWILPNLLEFEHRAFSNVFLGQKFSDVYSKDGSIVSTCPDHNNFSKKCNITFNQFLIFW